MSKFRNPINLADIEAALDGHSLYVAAGQGRFYLARRNGQTKRWKREPDRFRLPIKYGFKSCAAIEHDTDRTLMRIAASRDDAESRS